MKKVVATYGQFATINHIKAGQAAKPLPNKLHLLRQSTKGVDMSFFLADNATVVMSLAVAGSVMVAGAIAMISTAVGCIITNIKVASDEHI